ncbi:hypothetical protein NBRC110019_14110 [Neptunitalea chrysea]|uniref:Thioredoxin domain-containing protein n=1 Tax=Neptunitalea chrysea TaxID=1647581 RepID=A0A9W6EV10_9FLAO|nr:TlpA disulfide reductase family protein [Neptunitalea chrysea]GLB52371.1 hypothetical protein NBRC110019_14110 [Neptunitalea chrysea]
MKRLSLLLAALVIFSCTKAPKTYMIFSGKVTNMNSETVRVSGHGLKEELPIDNNGNFSDTLKIEEPGYYTFKIGNETSTFYLANGEDINLTIDTKLFDESIAYTGEGAPENNYLAQKYLSDEAITADAVSFYSLPEDQYIAKIDSLEAAHKDALSKAGVSDEFEDLEDKNLMYESYVALNRYPSYHAYYGKAPNYEPSDAIMEFKSKLDYDNEADAKNYNNYISLVLSDFGTKLKEVSKDSTMYKAVALIEEKKSPTIQESIMSNLAYEIRPGNEETARYYFHEFNKISNDDEFKEAILKKYTLVKTLVKGAPSSNFIYEGIDGKEHSLDEYKGKYVYIDIWATWCGPCKREIPFLKKVEEEFKDKNIEFIGISVDVKADKQKWITFIEENQLVGTQLFADKDWNSEFMKAYGVNSIPRFILLDTEGKILSADALRPSQTEELTDLLNSLESINI